MLVTRRGLAHHPNMRGAEDEQEQRSTKGRPQAACGYEGGGVMACEHQDSLEELARRARVLDLALYGATYLASHSIPGDGWEATLWPLSEFASDLHRDLRQLVAPAETIADAPPTGVIPMRRRDEGA